MSFRHIFFLHLSLWNTTHSVSLWCSCRLVLHTLHQLIQLVRVRRAMRRCFGILNSRCSKLHFHTLPNALQLSMRSRVRQLMHAKCCPPFVASLQRRPEQPTGCDFERHQLAKRRHILHEFHLRSLAKAIYVLAYENPTIVGVQLPRDVVTQSRKHFLGISVAEPTKYSFQKFL